MTLVFALEPPLPDDLVHCLPPLEPASDRLEQQQIVVAASQGQSKRRLTAPKRKTCRVCPHQRIPPPSSFAASEPEARALCRHRRDGVGLPRFLPGRRC